MVEEASFQEFPHTVSCVLMWFCLAQSKNWISHLLLHGSCNISLFSINDGHY